MGYKLLELAIAERHAVLTLDHEPRNMLTGAMVQEINRALDEIRDNVELEVLVLRGARDTFSDGLDLGEFGKARVRRLLGLYHRVFESLRMMDLVSIAAVEGRAAGAGWELALGCNLIVAAENATFQLPEITHGIFPTIATTVLPRVAPRRKAMEWILTGCEVGARELLGYGLANRIFAPGRFDEDLDAFVREITSKSGPVLQLAKQAQYAAYYASYDEALPRVKSLFLRQLLELEDAQEGLAAWREERTPEWKNR